MLPPAVHRSNHAETSASVLKRAASPYLRNSVFLGRRNLLVINSPLQVQEHSVLLLGDLLYPVLTKLHLVSNKSYKLTYSSVKKMCFHLSRAWVKIKLLGPHQESGFRPSDSALQRFTAKPKRYFSELGHRDSTVSWAITKLICDMRPTS